MIKGVFRTVCAAAVLGWMGGRKPSQAAGLGPLGDVQGASSQTDLRDRVRPSWVRA
jgi:hypothetical protein